MTSTSILGADLDVRVPHGDDLAAAKACRKDYRAERQRRHGEQGKDAEEDGKEGSTHEGARARF